MQKMMWKKKMIEKRKNKKSLVVCVYIYTHTLSNRKNIMILVLMPLYEKIDYQTFFSYLIFIF